MTPLGFPNPDAPLQSWPRRRVAPLIVERGAVAAAHPLVTQAGLAQLQSGGNAVDAAVSAALVAAVVMPEMCGLGGDLFAVLHEPASDTTVAICGSGASPRAATLEFMRQHGDDNGELMPFRGPHSISVPGMVDAYSTLLERFGRRSFGEVAEPAIHYAETGHPVGLGLASYLKAESGLLQSYPSTAAVLARGGETAGQGEILKQPDLARTLRTLVDEGPASFYRGSVARAIVKALQRMGSLFSEEDFALHTTRVTEPLWGQYGLYRVAVAPPPSQGLVLLESLHIARQALAHTEEISSADWVHLMVEAKKRAFADRIAYARDPGTGEMPLETLLSPQWARQRAASIDPHRATDIVPPGGLQDGDTTYIAVADANGMMVSLIQSVSAAFGSGVIAGNTGVVLNNRAGRGFSLEDGHPNQYAPGKITMSTLLSCLVFDDKGRAVLAAGTPGGDGQPQWILQMLSWLIDGGVDVQTAVEAPRWTSWPGTDPINLPNPYELRLERRFDDETVAVLRALGHRVVMVDDWNAGGAAQAIARDPDSGRLCAGSDPRVEGTAAGF